jgi:mRNA-degrading endonuclease RelE of RelBE toxin-antitoxin system
MKVVYKTTFSKDLEKLPAFAKESVEEYLLIIKSAKALQDIPKLKKMKGLESLYRAAITYRYRLLLQWDKDTQTITMLAAISRENAYKK